MFQIILTGLCLASALTHIVAQSHQNDLGFQPTNNLTVAKGDGVGWGVPPPPPPGGWPAIPPPPVGWPAPPPNDCTNPGTPVGGCTENLAVSAYLPSTNCECFFQCTILGPVSQPCPSGLYFNPTSNVCDYPASSGCTPGPTTVGTTARPDKRFGVNIIAKKV